MSRHYVVTGDSGFVGERLCRQLLRQGRRVVGISRSAAQLSHEDYERLSLDLADAEAVRRHAKVFRSATAVFHLAARLPGENDHLDAHIQGNLRTTETVLEVLDGANVPLVLSSSMSVYGLSPDSLPVDEDQVPRPDEPYGLTKLAAEYAAERTARAGRVPVVALRYPGIFGVGYDYGAIHLYVTKALHGDTVSVYGNGRVVRDYVHVDDVVSANLLAAEAASRTQWALYHIGGGDAMPLVDVARMAVVAVGRGKVETNDRPAPFDFAFDISRARRDLGYAPLALKERITEYVKELQLVSTKTDETGSNAS